MGISATAMIIGSSILQGVSGIAEGQEQKAIIKTQRDAAIRQAQAQAREQEMARLKQMRQDVANNLAMGAMSGTTYEGTREQLVSGNISSAEEDINRIGLMESANIGAIRSSASQQLKSIRMNQVGSVIGSAAQGAMMYGSMDQKLTPSKTKSVLGG